MENNQTSTKLPKQIILGVIVVNIFLVFIIYKVITSLVQGPLVEEELTNQVVGEVTEDTTNMMNTMVKMVRDIEQARYSNITLDEIRKIEVEYYNNIDEILLGTEFIIDKEDEQYKYSIVENLGYYSTKVSIKPLNVMRSIYKPTITMLDEEVPRHPDTYYTIYSRADLVLRDIEDTSGTGDVYTSHVDAVYSFNSEGKLVDYKRSGLSFVKDN